MKQDERNLISILLDSKMINYILVQDETKISDLIMKEL